MVILSEIIEGSSSSSTNDHKYDVFLSFRGADTRHSFTDHLYKSLLDANISTFLDYESIETGVYLKPELHRAIKASRASIIVLSNNYAASTWCLDELVLILEHRMISNHIVIPIFYHVDPTHVRKQQSSFGDAIAKHKQTMEAETNANKRSLWAQKIDQWNKALKEVADLKGMEVNGRLETEFIDDIVKEIHRRFHVPLLKNALPQLIGMEYSIKFVTSWLKDDSSDTGDILTIVGMDGIGKTSLAKYVYGLHHHEFHVSSYVEDISRRCDEKFNGMLDVLEQLCSDISKRSSVKVHDASIYTSNIENVVARKKVFLVLDDIGSLDQLDALLGSRSFHPGSKIIITTKDVWLTESCLLFKTTVKPKHIDHWLKGLPKIESLKLLCYHAFMSNDPKAGYEEVSEKLVNYCEGNPLALEVLGKSLHNQDVVYWEGCIDRLKKDISSPINNVLRMSFDSLASKNDMDLFKHIACFFVGMDRDVCETILKACHINTRSGITNLIDRCLLHIKRKNKLMMHRLLQEMGRFLVRQESLDKPWKRSRLWDHKESFNVLKRKKGKGNLVGIALDMRMLEKEKLGGSFELKTNAFNNMNNLMLLQLNYVHLNGSYGNFPEELRWLCMHGFPLKSIPSELPMENLVALDLSYSKIESFDIWYANPQQPVKKQKLTDSLSRDKRLLGSLQILNLSFCENLCSLDLNGLSALERLIVTNCISLVEVCESIEQCAELVLIDLSYCNKLEKLPQAIGTLKNVKTLFLNGCNLDISTISSWDMDSSAIVETIPHDFKFFTISLQRYLVRLSLANNNLYDESFPMDFSGLSMLKVLHLDDNPIVSLPKFVRSLPKLEVLSFRNCQMLKMVESVPDTLCYLSLTNSRLLMPPHTLHAPHTLTPSDFKGITSLLDDCNLGESRNKIRDMDSSEMHKAKNTNTKTSSSIVVKTIPSYLKFFTSSPRSLVKLSLANNNLSTESFPMDFSCLSMLEELYLDGNPIVSLPKCVRSLPRLMKLSMRNCKMLKSIEFPPRTLTHLNLISDYKLLLQKVVFYPEMSPLNFIIDWELLAPSSFEFEGMIKIQPIASVEEKILHGLGWTELDIFNERRVVTPNFNRRKEESEIQMYYEFGIFSTIYGGKELPSWIHDTSNRRSISFTIPSSPNNLRGLNFCCVQKFRFLYKCFDLPNIIISNMTKNRTWIYKHCTNGVRVGGYWVILLSHWMFGENEMEDGDQVTITARENLGQVMMCGMSFVYDDGKTDEEEEEEEDVLSYYKSWNHIIGGDLSPFETTAGEYLLHTKQFMQTSNSIPLSSHFVTCGIPDGANFKERKVWFKALAQRKSSIPGLGHEL